MHEFYSDTGSERVGFILKDGSFVEVPNVSGDPEKGFEIDGRDILAHLASAKGTWHTHPGQDANLSMADYRAFIQFPDWEHWIVGANKDLRRYFVEDGVVLCDE